MRERDFPYLYTTWLSGLLTGDKSCEWAAWFKAHYSDYLKVPNSFNFAQWKRDHTVLLNRKRDELESAGYKTWTEGQNKYNLRGTAAILGGKADLVATSDTSEYLVIDAKTGVPRDSDIAQVQIYMYALPRAIERYAGGVFRGLVVYPDHETEVPAETITPQFIKDLGDLIKRLAADEPARKIPSSDECHWCEITSLNCPERTDEAEETVKTADF